MMKSGNILIVFPHNFYELRSGVHKRYFGLVHYLKERGYSIDLIGLRHFESTWENFSTDNTVGLIDELFLYNFRIGYHKQLIMNLPANLPGNFSNRKSGAGAVLPDYAFPGMNRLFRQVTERKRYDFIIVGYVYWANLLNNKLPAGVTTVLTMEDFISRKLPETYPGKFDFETLVPGEVQRVDLFDKVLCLSQEEMNFFSARTKHPGYHYVPVFMDLPKITSGIKKYDLLFMGSDNPDNIEGLDWFFRHVFPLLPADFKILIVGRISGHAPENPSVTRIAFVADPGEVYSTCRIALNPLQKGTGMKVKLVESMAYAIPMVNTLPGICGFPANIANQLIVAENPADFAQAVIRLLTDHTWYSEQSAKALGLFRTHFETGVVKLELDKIFPSAEFPILPEIPA